MLTGSSLAQAVPFEGGLSKQTSNKPLTVLQAQQYQMQLTPQRSFLTTPAPGKAADPVNGSLGGWTQGNSSPTEAKSRLLYQNLIPQTLLTGGNVPTRKRTDNKSFHGTGYQQPGKEREAPFAVRGKSHERVIGNSLGASTVPANGNQGDGDLTQSGVSAPPGKASPLNPVSNRGLKKKAYSFHRLLDKSSGSGNETAHNKSTSKAQVLDTDHSMDLGNTTRTQPSATRAQLGSKPAIGSSLMSFSGQGPAYLKQLRPNSRGKKRRIIDGKEGIVLHQDLTNRPPSNNGYSRVEDKQFLANTSGLKRKSKSRSSLLDSRGGDDRGTDKVPVVQTKAIQLGEFFATKNKAQDPKSSANRSLSQPKMNGLGMPARDGPAEAILVTKNKVLGGPNGTNKQAQEGSKSGIHKPSVGGSLKNSMVETGQTQPSKEAMPIPEGNNKKLVYSCRTRKGFSPNSLEKPNQDSFFAKVNFMERPNYHLFGVCDGHGVHGHLVSQYVTKHLQIQLAKKILMAEAGKKPDTEGLPGSQPGATNQPIAVEELIFAAVDSCVKDLASRSGIDLMFSGTTCNFCLIKDDLLYVTNIGDSRAILGFEEKAGLVQAKALSYDHKPEFESEKARILKNNGRIGKIQTQSGHFVGPDRVWLKEEDLPGLAMTRSIGDLVAESVGVTWKPGSPPLTAEITIYRLCIEDKIIVIASDGVWEVMENQEVDFRSLLGG